MGDNQVSTNPSTGETAARREPSEAAILEAYKQANEDHRHYGRLRWMQLTAFIALSVSLFAFAFNSQIFTGPGFYMALLGGIVLSFLFGIIEWRINRALERYVVEIRDIEDMLRLVSWRRSDNLTGWRKSLDEWVRNVACDASVRTPDIASG